MEDSQSVSLCVCCLPVNFRCLQILSFVIILIDLMGMIGIGFIVSQKLIPILYLITYPFIGWGILSMGGFGIISLNILLVQIYRLGNVMFLKYQFWLIVFCQSIVKLAFSFLFLILTLNYSAFKDSNNSDIKPLKPSDQLEQYLKQNFNFVFLMTCIGVIYSIYTLYILYSVNIMLINLQDVISVKITKKDVLFVPVESINQGRQTAKVSPITSLDDSPFKSRNSFLRSQRKSIVSQNSPDKPN